METIPLYGRNVSASDYECLKQLERIAFGLTPTDWPDTMAHAVAIDVAIEALATMRLQVGRKRRTR